MGLILLYYVDAIEQYRSFWVFAQPLTNLKITEQNSSLVFSPFIQPSNWWQYSIDHASFEAGNTLMYFLLQQVSLANISALSLYSFPFSAAGLIILVLSVVSILKSFNLSSDIRTTSLVLALIPFTLYYPYMADNIVSDWFGYSLFYFALASSVKFLSGQGKRQYAIITVLLLAPQVMVYHTMAATSVLFFVILAFYAITFKIFLKRNIILERYVYVAILSIGFFAASPYFEWVLYYGGSFFHNPLSFWHLILDYASQSNYYSSFSLSPTIYARIGEGLPFAFLSILGAYLLVKDSILHVFRRGLMSDTDLFIDGLYFAGIVSLLINAAGQGGLPRLNESYLFLFITIPLMVARHFQRLKIRPHLVPQMSYKFWKILVVSILLVIVIGSTVAIAVDPLDSGKPAVMTSAEYSVTRWVDHSVRDPFFANVFLLGIILPSDPASQVFSLYTTPLNVDSVAGLYSNVNDFSNTLSQWKIKIAIITQSDITSAVFLTDISIKPLPNNFSSYPFEVFYDNGRDRVVTSVAMLSS